MSIFFQTASHAQWNYALSLGTHFTSAGSNRNLYSTRTSYASPYVGTGGVADYTKFYHVHRDSTHKVNLRRKVFYGLGGCVDFTRYGFLGTYLFPSRMDYECKIRHLTVGTKQHLFLSHSKYVILDLNLTESYKFNIIQGDSQLIYQYDFKTSSGRRNIRNVDVGLGSSLYFYMNEKTYFNIGFSNGLIPLVKHHTQPYQVMREFYFHMNLMRVF